MAVALETKIKEVQAISDRLKEMNRNKDGKGAFLGDGFPSKSNVEIRALHVAQLLDEYIALLKTV